MRVIAGQDDCIQGSHNGVWVEEGTASVPLGSSRKRIPIVELPEAHAKWIDDGRRRMYDAIVDGPQGVSFFPQHLPVVVTQSQGQQFPFNCGNKGVGYLPQGHCLEECVESLERVMHDTRGLSWKKSLGRRIDVMREFYFDESKIDRRALTTLEIFEKQTFQNVCDMPLASLLYTGHSPQFVSFQLNCAVEVVAQGDPRHTFIRLARTLFEYDEFHITQPQFPYAYIFWITEVKDKTPFRVPVQKDKVEFEVHDGTLSWTEGATELLGRAPQMIQEFIRDCVEDYARERGCSRICEDIVLEAKRNMMGDM